MPFRHGLLANSSLRQHGGPPDSLDQSLRVERRDAKITPFGPKEPRGSSSQDMQVDPAGQYFGYKAAAAGTKDQEAGNLDSLGKGPRVVKSWDLSSSFTTVPKKGEVCAIILSLAGGVDVRPPSESLAMVLVVIRYTTANLSL